MTVKLIYVYILLFCELTSQDYVPKMRIRLIEKVLDVGSHKTFELFHTFVNKFRQAAAYNGVENTLKNAHRTPLILKIKNKKNNTEQVSISSKPLTNILRQSAAARVIHALRVGTEDTQYKTDPLRTKTGPGTKIKTGPPAKMTKTMVFQK